MKASKFSDAQKAFILKQGAYGIPVAEICRRAGISQEITAENSKSERSSFLGSDHPTFTIPRPGLKEHQFPRRPIGRR
ncbi:hypothetical protein B5V02_22265 [Mesorhizobium kowhaii]|uniref:Transposase n=1 Tax=Mesorhizobium kowhaii TaxID=1300272 RepID=A0A2W7BZE9_9HYPH|nr:hypothetical protein B5V02_22265 [Mesorhizobium kowhaii]